MYLILEECKTDQHQWMRFWIQGQSGDQCSIIDRLMKMPKMLIILSKDQIINSEVLTIKYKDQIIDSSGLTTSCLETLTMFMDSQMQFMEIKTKLSKEIKISLKVIKIH